MNAMSISVSMRAPVAAATLALLSGAGCASSSGALALPHNWNDQYLDLAADKSSLRPTLAVLPFGVSERVKAGGDLIIGDILATELFKTGRFVLVERSRLNEILKEQKLQRSNLVDQTTAVQVGKLVGASAVVFGKLSMATQQKFDKFAYDVIRTEVRIEAHAVNTSTGQFVFTEAADGFSEAKIVTDASGRLISGAVDVNAEYGKAAKMATLALSAKLAKQFPVAGFVISIDRDQLVTDIGSEKELAPGDRVLMIRPLGRIIHPATKKPIGWNKKILGLAEVQTVELSTSTARVIRREEGDVIKSGDIAVVQPRN